MTDTIYSCFQSVVSRYPDQPAIVENDRILTFQELSDFADRIAAGLPDNIRSVGIVMDHGALQIASILAVLKRGARYVPAEPDYPIERMRSMMKEAETDFILTQQEYFDRLEGLPVRQPDDSDRTQEAVCSDEQADLKGDLPAYVLYTSGTTGRPKGVCVTNRNVCHYVRAFACEFHPGPGDIMLQNSVCSFDIFVEEVFASLLNGAALAIPGDDDKSDISRLMAFVRRHHVTMISGFPYLLAEMNRLESIPSSLGLLISGGDVLRNVYVDHLLDQVTVYNTYGPSETTVCAAYYNCTDGCVLDDGTYPIGHPVRGAEIHILDPNGRDVPVGQLGEICICGDGVSQGYIGDHDAENRAFVLLPSGDRMYRSGDMGYILPSGDLAFLHRKDTQIMIYGKRVEVSEVESRLCQCTDVEEAVVRAFKSEDGLSYMIAYLVSANPDLKVSEIRNELAENLTSYMIPEFFVRLPKIPLNVNGKPDEAKLPVVMKDGDLS